MLKRLLSPCTWLLLAVSVIAQAGPEQLERWRQQFPEADTDRDGTLTLEEADAYRKAFLSGDDSKTNIQLDKALNALPASDLDGDGILTRAEWDRYQKQARANKKPPEPDHADVSYGPYDRNRLDVYLAESDRPTPVVIHFHGGGWLVGDKRGVKPNPYLALGFTVVSANYRFSKGDPEAAPYPAPMRDCARVVQYVRSRAADWNIDPDRVALTGGSAGAVNSMWIAYRDDMADPDSDEPVARQSTRVRCVVPVAGPTTLEPEVILKRVGGRPGIHPALAPLFGAEKVEAIDPVKARDASPVTHVSPDDPPTWLLYGSALGDTPLPAEADVNHVVHHPEFGVLLKEKFDAAGVECHLQSKGDGKPGGAHLEFLKRYLSD